jgi:hypothetical protein
MNHQSCRRLSPSTQSASTGRYVSVVVRSVTVPVDILYEDPLQNAIEASIVKVSISNIVKMEYCVLVLYYVCHTQSTHLFCRAFHVICKLYGTCATVQHWILDSFSQYSLM